VHKYKQAGSLGGTRHTPCRRPLPDYYDLALADWLAQAEIKLDKRRGRPDARRYGEGQTFGLIGQQGMEMDRAGQSRAGLGNALDGGGIARDEPLFASSYVVASCVSCSARSSALHPIRRVDRACTAAHAYASEVGERSIAGDEWMDGTGRAWEQLHGSHLGWVQKLLRSSLPASLSGICP
jgi:hypothetical protein